MTVISYPNGALVPSTTVFEGISFTLERFRSASCSIFSTGVEPQGQADVVRELQYFLCVTRTA